MSASSTEDYSRYQDPDYAADFHKIFSLQSYFLDRRRNPKGMKRAEAKKLHFGNPEAWRKFILGLKSSKCRQEVILQVEKKYRFKIFPESSSQAA